MPLSDAIHNTDVYTAKPEERIDGELNEGVNEGVNEGANERINERINEGLNTLLSAIIRNPGIQARNLAVILNNRPIKTIKRQISELTQQKFIERSGSKKTGGCFSLK